MTRAQKIYQEWLSHPQLSAEEKADLQALSPEEREEAFYQDLQFGTAGLRGILGLGTNRMNVYTVAQAAEGFARYLASKGEEVKKRGIAISYDSRHCSPEFAELSARIFVYHGIQVRLSDELRPVPLLSFAIRHFNCAGGIMITASHNPKAYNGFKAYGEDGGQLPVEISDQVSAEIAQITDPIACYYSIPSREDLDQDPRWLTMGQDLDQAYDALAMAHTINPGLVAKHKDLSIVYSPLHGSGNKPVRRLLARLGFENISVVPEQELPDGDFPTAPYPNPEAREALELGIQLAEEKKADLLIATDPDADRLGLACRTREGEFVVLSGNQIGCLLLDYILGAKQAQGSLEDNSFVVSTVVSSRLPDAICAHYGVKLYRTLTGFKNIASVIQTHDDEGQEHFQFGYEESFGYLVGKFVRDKDAVSASLLVGEMAAAAAEAGETVYDRLQRLYQRHGYAAEKTISLVREGIEGQERIKEAMRVVRSSKADFFSPLQAEKISDFASSEVLDLQSGQTYPLAQNKSDVLVYELAGGDWFATRPSGTEPKLKIYMGVMRPDKATAEKDLATLEQRVADKIAQALDA